MPPFDRRPKTPTVSRPTSGFDAPADSAKPARMPWEREGDDEFGPPPALDVTPGEAESEAKRMIYEKTHPMHAALMQNAHIDHNYAMRRYSALTRRAWGPAARDLAVQPARIIGDDGLARPSATAQGSPLTATSTLSAPPAQDGGPAAFKQAPLARVFTPTVEGSKAPKQEETPGTSVTPPRRRLPVERAIEVWGLNLSELVESTPEVLSDREESSQQAHDRAAAARRGDPNAGDPPFAIHPDVYADAKAVVESRDDLSDAEKYVIVSLIGYEGLGYDRVGDSLGGITQTNFDQLKAAVSALRELEGRDPVAATTVAEVSVDELIDLQRAYLAREFERKSTITAQEVIDSDHLNQLGSNALSFQIADVLYNYGSAARAYIFQHAVNETIHRMSGLEQTKGGYRMVRMDDLMGDETMNAVRALANDPAHQTRFLDALRLARTWWNLKERSYFGNNRWRIWGITRDR